MLKEKVDVDVVIRTLSMFFLLSSYEIWECSDWVRNLKLKHDWIDKENSGLNLT
jgi:hypothetical protein